VLDFLRGARAVSYCAVVVAVVVAKDGGVSGVEDAIAVLAAGRMRMVRVLVAVRPFWSVAM
jgi:hypothetical protein